MPAGYSHKYLPAIDEGDQIVVQYYHAVIQRAAQQAEWVAYLVTAERLRGDVKRTNNFRVDPSVMTGSAVLGDYKGSGFDRGHLAPAAAMAWSKDNVRVVFPVEHESTEAGFNRCIWKKLEAKIRFRPSE